MSVTTDIDITLTGSDVASVTSHSDFVADVSPDSADITSHLDSDLLGVPWCDIFSVDDYLTIGNCNAVTASDYVAVDADCSQCSFLRVMC